MAICRIKDTVILSLAEKISTALYRSGISISPIDYAIKILRNLFILAIALAALVFSLWFLPSMLFQYVLVIVVTLPFLILADIVLKPIMATYTRRKLCERELPFFATYLTMASASGISAPVAFEHMRDFKYLPQFKKEWFRIEKVRRLYALNPSEAIIFEGKYHPVDSVKDLYNTLVSAHREGGEVFAIMRDELLKLFSILQGRLKTLSDKFSLMTSGEIIAFIMLPMGTVTVGVLFSSVLGIPVLILACFLFPTVVAVFISLIIDTYMPKELTEEVQLGYLIKCSIPVPILTLIIATFLGTTLPVYYALGMLLVIFTAPAIRHYSRIRKRTKDIIGALPSFTRSVTEEAKKGNSPRVAIVKLCEGRSFNESFDKLLHRLTGYLKLGCPIADAVSIVEGPWIARVSFELLDRADMMGAEPKTLDSLSELISNMYMSHKSMESQTRFFVVMSYVNTILLVFSISIVVEIVARLFTKVTETITMINLPLGMAFINSDQLQFLVMVAYTAVVYNSYLLGLLGGKASKGGSIVDGLFNSMICTLLSMAGILLFKDLGFIRLLTFGGQ